MAGCALRKCAAQAHACARKSCKLEPAAAVAS